MWKWNSLLHMWSTPDHQKVGEGELVTNPAPCSTFSVITLVGAERGSCDAFLARVEVEIPHLASAGMGEVGATVYTIVFGWNRMVIG